MSERRVTKHRPRKPPAAGKTKARARSTSGDSEKSFFDEKNAVAALQRERDFSRGVMDTAGALIVVLDPNGRIVGFNRACEKLTGYTAGEIRGMEIWHQLLAPEEVDSVKAVFAELKAGNFPNRNENYWVTRTGERRWIAWQNTAILRPDGAVDYIIGTGIDITEQRQAEIELRESERNYKSLVERANDGIVILQDGVVKFANERLAAMNGTSVADLLGSPLLEHVAPEAREMVIDHYRRRFAGESVSSTYETILQRHDGTRVPVELNAGLITDQGKPADMVVVRDITERKRAESELRRYQGRLEELVRMRTAAVSRVNAELEAANQELESFSYMVSHDLRAPLRAIDGFSRIALEEAGEALSEETRRHLQMVRDSTARMAQLIEDLLAFSRLTRTPLRQMTVSPATIVAEVLSDLRAAESPRQVEVSVADLPPCEADPSLLKQVWVNLLANAFKFTRQRAEPEISIGGMPAASPDEVVYFVRDNGVGFDMAHAERLFGVFQRFHSSDEYEGAGVGLAIVQRIVRRHGGRIWADAKPNEGATFFFTLKRGDSTGRNL